MKFLNLYYAIMFIIALILLDYLPGFIPPNSTNAALTIIFPPSAVNVNVSAPSCVTLNKFPNKFLPFTNST